MKAISFKISGKTAIFKKPDVNSYAYFTYNNIHKVALLGILGAIIGLGGYTQLFDKNRGLKKKDTDFDDGFPQFYEKLKEFKISIIPLAKNGYFSKKIETFNNSVGYASQEVGGNLVVREQWLENPQWRIIILENDTQEYIKLKEYLLNKKSVFIPYLGKNDHIANIDEVEEISVSKQLFDENGVYVDSLFIADSEIDGFEKEGEMPFLFQEYAPIALDERFHFYKLKKISFTNLELNQFPPDTYSYENRNYTFI